MFEWQECREDKESLESREQWVEEPGRIRRGAEAASQQCGRFGKQELEVNMGTAWGYFVFVCGEGPGK